MEDYTYPSVFWMYSLMALFVVGAVFFLVKAGEERSGELRRVAQVPDAGRRLNRSERERRQE